MKNVNAQYSYIDALIIILNIAAGRGNYLLYGLLGMEKTTHVLAVAILADFIYLFYNAKYIAKQRIGSSILSIAFALLVYNWFNVLRHGTDGVILLGEFLLVWILFFFILKVQISLLLNKSNGVYNNIYYLSKGYLVLASISIIGVICTFFALEIGIIEEGRVIHTDYMEANMEMNDDLYSWCFLSILMKPNAIVRVPFFQNFGTLCGLYHEPHILALNTFPCLILLLGFAKKMKVRILIMITAIIIMFMGGSATNVFVSLACLMVYFLLKFKTSKLSAVLSFTLFMVVLMFYVTQSDGTFVSFLIDRADSGNTSQQYTTDLLTYTFSPKTLLGTNFLSTSFMKDGPGGQDVGLIPCALFCIFLFLYIKNTVKMLFSANDLFRAVGFASLYYILHSLKGGMTLFYQTLPLLIIVLQTYILKNGAVRTSKFNR